MDLISRKYLIDKLTELLDYYRSDTDLGQYCRQGVSASIEEVKGDYFTLNHLGYSELIDLQNLVKNKINELKQEETINIFSITGLYSMRYTLNPDKAKAIFLEEVNYINQDDGLNDVLEESFKISIKKVRESDLYLYVLE
ncbi:MAG: hypothetical protein ACRDBQ_23285 [Shewanella sp.]